MEIQLYSKNKHHILYDAQQIPQISEHWFQPEWWQNKAHITEPTGGRGQAFFIQPYPVDAQPEIAQAPTGGKQPSKPIQKQQPKTLVLRHYRRGGLIAKLIQDQYFYTSLTQSRPWQEFELTKTLFQQGLPVPRPLAAHIERQGLFYRADLLTERLPNAKPFAEYLDSNNQQKNSDQLWQNVGETIARFHQAGLNHFDLNANNILLDHSGQVWLIDFDRCHFSNSSETQWKEANIQRLQRSILKLTRQTELPKAWSYLYDNYLIQLKK